LRPLPDKSAATITKNLALLFCDIGLPKIIQSDNGTEFVNSIINSLVKECGIDHRLTTAYHPRANGIAERYVQAATQTLRKLSDGNNNNWDQYIPATQFALNTRVVSLHNSTPYSLFFARPHNDFNNYASSKGQLLTEKELLERIEYMTKIVFPAISDKAAQSQQQMIDRFKGQISNEPFPIGSFVMTQRYDKNNKLEANYSDYALVDGHNFPKRFTLTIEGDEGKVFSDMQYSKADFNQNLELPFTVPSRYKVIK